MKIISNFLRVLAISSVFGKVIVAAPSFTPNASAPLDQRVAAIEQFIVSSLNVSTQTPPMPTQTPPMMAPQVAPMPTAPMMPVVASPMVSASPMMPAASPAIPMAQNASPIMPGAPAIPVASVPMAPAAPTAPATI